MRFGLRLTLLILMGFAFQSQAVEMKRLEKEKWIRLQTKDFDIVTDLDEKKARFLLNDLEAYRYFHRKILGLKLVDDVDKLKILAIGSTSTFKNLGLPKMWAGVFHLSAGEPFAIANVDHYSDDIKNPSVGRHILLHEYLHFLSRYSASQRRFPVWFEEGRAEYYGTFKFDGTNIYIGNPKAIMFRTSGLFARTGALQINSEEIFRTKELPMRSERQSDLSFLNRFYGRSFFIVHYLNSSVELRHSMAVYLAEVLNGSDEAKALQLAFNQTFAEFDKSVIDYVTHSLLMRVISVTDGNIEFPVAFPEVSVLTKDDARGQLSFYLRAMGLE